MSDLHVGSRSEDLCTQVDGILSELKPQLLVVSGDLVNHPFPWLMKRARQLVDRWAELAGIVDKGRILVIPGNHDYKIWGNVGLRRLTRVPFEVYFGDEARRGSLTSRLVSYAELSLAAMWPFARPQKWSAALSERSLLFEPLEVEGLDIFVLRFNSTPVAQWLATGSVSSDQIQRAVRALRERGGKPGVALAMVHHHPVPIAYVPTDRRDRAEESFMLFYNAGTFLRELATHGIDVVLHGHKHFAGWSRMTYATREGECSVVVAAAGSACHRSRYDPRGAHLNILRLYDDERLELEQRFFTRDQVSASQERPFELRNLASVAALRRARLAQRGEYSARCRTRTVRLTRDGYSHVREDFEGCLPPSECLVGSIVFEISAPAPAYLRTLAAGASLPHVRVGSEQLSLRQAKLEIDLGTQRAQADGPFDVHYEYRMMNGHALSEAEFSRKYASDADPWEYATVSCEEDVEELELQVVFPDDDSWTQLVRKECDAQALYRPLGALADAAIEHGAETRRLRGRVQSDDESRTLRLRVPQPIPGFDYRIRWWLVPSPAPTPERLRKREIGHRLASELIRRAERGVVAGQPDTVLAAVEEGLREVLRSVEERYPWSVPRERLDASLMVLAGASGGARGATTLRFVASHAVGIGDLFPIALRPGEGCAGFAFEKQRVLFHNAAASSAGLYITPEELQDEFPRGRLTPASAMFAVPVVDPQSGLCLGVLSLSSADPASRLLRFLEWDQARQQREMDFLLALTATLWLTTMKAWMSSGGTA